MQSTLERNVASRPAPASTASRYARCIDVSKRIRWEIERDVIRGRRFDLGRKFVPDSLSKIGQLAFLSPAEKRFLSQIQGRTYANMLGLLEHCFAAKSLAIGEGHGLADEVALEALARMADEELKHQELFRRLDAMAAPAMPPGYVFVPEPNAVTGAVLGLSGWAVLGLALHIDLSTQAHYRSSIDPDPALSELWKDVFLFHWKEESQHAILDELEWRSEHAQCSAAERERGVRDLIELVGALDGIVRMQAAADSDYFIANAGRTLSSAEQASVHDLVLKAYHGQYVASGAQEPRFAELLTELVTPAQMDRIGAALAPILAHTAS